METTISHFTKHNVTKFTIVYSSQFLLVITLFVKVILHSKMILDAQIIFCDNEA